MKTFNYKSTFMSYGVQIRSHGRRFLAYGDGSTPQLFLKHSDAKMYKENLAEHLSRGATLRIVKVKAILIWTAPARPTEPGGPKT